MTDFASPTRRVPLLGLMLGIVFGCIDIIEAPNDDAGSESGGSCIVGSLACMCTPGGGCDPGLTCMNGVCIEQTDETDTDSCSALGCACNAPGDCDPGLQCTNGICVLDDCGNGEIDSGEACDDGNFNDGDGCDSDCSLTRVLQLALGGLHTCALLEGGRIRCWGTNTGGQLGYGFVGNVGDDESPAVYGDLPLPRAISIDAGGGHTCAVFESNEVRCWGINTSGQLGLGNSSLVAGIGDDEPLDNLPKIELGGSVNEIATGVVQSCARVGGQLRCWGDGAYGQLGLANVTTVGDDEQPLTVPAVMLGGEASRITAGGSHGCAIMSTGGVRCWGRGDTGQLGLMSSANVGDDEHPNTLPELSVIPNTAPPGTTVVDIGVGLQHSCALLSTGDVICWGIGVQGQLGYGDPQTWGDGPGEAPSVRGPVPTGGVATALAVGYQHTCVLLDNGELRCWGVNESGQLGYGNEDSIGASNTPAGEDPVPIGAPAIGVAAGGAHTCAVVEGERVMCWGSNQFGQLGYGHTHSIGDDELPEIAGTIELW